MNVIGVSRMVDLCRKLDRLEVLYSVYYCYYYNLFTTLWILSGTTRVSRYQKSKPNLDLLKQEIVNGSGISWAICNAYSLRPPARSPPLRVTHGSTSSPIVHTHRVPSCMAQSRL